MNTLTTQLREHISGDVSDDAKNLEEKSNDASLFTVRPTVVVAPKNVEDIGHLVRIARDNGASLTPRAAATDMSGGPLSESIVVDVMKYFTAPVRVEKTKDGGFASTQPGVYYRDFEKQTLAQGLLMPSYPASRELCAMGGIVANNAGGEKSLTYGQTVDYVERVKAVVADGNEYEFGPLDEAALKEKLAQDNFEGDLYRSVHTLIDSNRERIRTAKPGVSKNSAGYQLWEVWKDGVFNLAKLFTGSQGTLGIITETTFRLIKPKQHERLVVIFLRDLRRLPELVNDVLKHKPESFESYDDKTFKIALRLLPQLVKQMGAANIFTLAFRFIPEALMFLTTGGLPKMVLLAEFTGDTDAQALEKAKKAKESLTSYGVKTRITSSQADSRKYWTIRRESFSLLRHHVRGYRTAPFIDDVIVPPKELPVFLPALEAILKPYNLLYSIVGHVGNGNFHVIPLVREGDKELPKIIGEISRSVYDLVLKHGGSITAEHNDGIIRTPFLRQMYGDEVYALFERVKEIFDPDGIFNPGKKVGGSLEYALKHIVLEPSTRT